MLLVVLNHLWPTKLTGGFIGVDVFFVISGFLITTHLLGEIRRTHKVDFAQFYARRARRLLPAALVVGLATLAATVIWLPAERWSRIAKEVFASAAYVENWVLSASAVNYYDRSQPATPAQHYWSLSVEEQFYLVWPLALVCLAWLLTRKTGNRAALRPTALAGALLVLFAVSFAFSVWQTEADRAAAYFNTFGRMWEFMCGALIAVIAPAAATWLARRGMTPVRGVAQLLGFGAIAIAALKFSETTVFPGPWALLPVLATALIIVAGPTIPRWSPTRLAELWPVRYLGDISYSLYLWHWPVIVIMPFMLAREIRFSDRLIMFAVSLILAVVTKHLIEDPGRKKLFVGARPRRTLWAALISVGVVGALCAALASTAVIAGQREQARIDAAVGAECFGAAALAPGNNCADPFGAALFPAGIQSEAPWSANAPECRKAPTERQIMAGNEPSLLECDFSGTSRGAADPEFKVWLIGDSHAEHWRPAFFDIARANGWRLNTTMQSSCPTTDLPLMQLFDTPVSDEKRGFCADWISDVNARIAADAPDLVIVSNYAWPEHVSDGSSDPLPEQIQRSMVKQFLPWTEHNTKVVVIRDSPTAGEAIGASCVAALQGRENTCLTPMEQALPTDPQFEAAQRLANERVLPIDLTDLFCKDGTCSGVIGGVPVYFDTDHVSRSYTVSLAPELTNRLSAALQQPLQAPLRSAE